MYAHVGIHVTKLGGALDVHHLCRRKVDATSNHTHRDGISGVLEVCNDRA